MSSRESVRNRFASRAFLALVALMFAALANAQGAFTLTTPQTQNNGQAGVCFTIEAFNTIKIWRLGANMDGGSIPLAIYYKQGAHAVASSAPANTGWTLAGTATATMATNANTQIPIDIDLIIPQGETYSFAIVDTASTRMNYTTGGTGQTADANIEINGQGWGLSSGSPFNASFFPRGYNGAVYYDFAGTKWTGDNSTDWNDAGNWDNGEVPDLEDGAIIPDAATTANDCHLPATAECKGFKIEAGGILVGNSGLVDMYGDWVNEGGTFVPGTSVISYVSDDVQKITTGMSTVGNIHIKNTMAEIEVTDSWEASQTGSLTADANTEMVFLSTTLNFSNTTISNQGVFKFGLTAGGVSNTLQEITGSPTVNFGVVEVNVADALDSVSFLSGVKFDDLKVMGAGNVTFNNTLEISTRFETTMDGTLQVLGAWTGDADLYFNNVSPLSLASVVAGSIYHAGDGTITLGGATLSREASFAALGPTTQAIFTGGLDVTGNFTANAGTVGIAAVTINGALSVGGTTTFTKGAVSITGVLLSTGQVDFVSPDNVDIGVGNSQAQSFSFNGSGALNVAGTLNTSNFYVANNGDVSISGNLSVTEQFFDDGMGNFEVSGALIAAGTQNQVIETTSNRPVNCAQIRVSALSATFKGEFTANSTSALMPSFLVNNGFGCVLDQGCIINLGTAGVGGGNVTINGVLTTAAGASSLRPILRGQASPAEYGLVRFGPSSVLAIDGLVFDRIGRTGSPFAIEILPGANVSSFNYVRITDAQSTAAAIQLSTDNLPKVIQEFEVSGTAPTNIDASAVSNFRVEIKKSTTGAGTRYGVPFEEDPNGVLFWEDPPVVSLLSGSNIPNVLAETSFTHQLSASGGNEPLHWTLLNAPSWLSISASGELSGTPPRAAIGTHVFVVFISDSTNPSLTASEVMTLIVDALSEVPITVITPELVTGKVGETYSFSLSAAGGSGVGFTWTLVDANALPMGLELRPDGVIYGMPDASAAGAYSFAVRVTDSQGNSQVKIYEIVIQTEYSDPVAINAALTDGANGGGGCALSSGSTALAFLLAMLAGLALWRRRES